MRKVKQVLPKQRNVMHNHPLLRKCEVHNKSRKRRRANEKVRVLREYVDQSVIQDCVLMSVFAGICCVWLNRLTATSALITWNIANNSAAPKFPLWSFERRVAESGLYRCL